MKDESCSHCRCPNKSWKVSGDLCTGIIDATSSNWPNESWKGSSELWQRRGRVCNLGHYLPLTRRILKVFVLQWQRREKSISDVANCHCQNEPWHDPFDQLQRRGRRDETWLHLTLSEQILDLCVRQLIEMSTDGWFVILPAVDWTNPRSVRSIYYREWNGELDMLPTTTDRTIPNTICFINAKE